MKLCEETITVVNKTWDAESGNDVYIGTVIRGVSWHCQTAANVDSEGLHAANAFTIRIPEDADFSGKRYVSPLEYRDSDPSETFTFVNGDVIVHGEIDSIITRPADLRKQFSEIATILGVTDNRNAPRGKHWKVVGG